MTILDYAPTTDRQTEEQRISPEMMHRKAEVRRFRESYKALMTKTGFDRKQTTEEFLRWIDSAELTDDRNNEKSIYWREDYIRRGGSELLREGESLFYEFTEQMERAKPYISTESYRRWFDRLYDTSERSSSASSFKLKLRWVRSELGQYVQRWTTVAKERDELVKDPQFRGLLSYEPELKILKDRNAFLDLHFDVRRGYVAQAKALIFATKKVQLDLYSQAKGKLDSAARKKFLGQGKAGIWLERIFRSSADPKIIERFVKGTGSNSLSDLMLNWWSVKQRYDGIKEKTQKRSEDTAVRGLSLIPEHQFLNLHYTERLRYVEELEHRLGDSPDPSEELPVFLKIRHAMDTRDWTDAAVMIAEAKAMSLGEKDRERLRSMERFVSQFSAKAGSDSLTDVTEAKHRLHELLHQIPTSLQPMVLRLLKGPHANRNINQLRWITYNNKWCRSHGYLNDSVARRGASEDNEKLTKFRAERGLDIGRHDVLDYETADKQYFQKEENSRHKATYMHANIKSGGVTNALAEWLEREQDARTLYWTTLNCHEDGDPKSEIWHNDLFYVLTEMRSLTRTIGGAGFMYGGPNSPLIGMN